MKGVLLGTDLMFRQDGMLVPIEINTNVGFDYINRIESWEEFLDLKNLTAFVKANKISEVYLEGTLALAIEYISEALQKYAKVYKVVGVENYNAIEDDDNKLLLRTFYNGDALVDSYCRDKIAFLNLIKNKSFGVGFLYKENNQVLGDIEDLPDNGEYPNVIVKNRYPDYVKADYPALYRFNSKEELLEFAENSLEENHLIMPCYYNENNLLETKLGKHVMLVRNWSLLVAIEDKLESIPLGNYTKLMAPIDDIDFRYDETGKLVEGRKAFINRGYFNQGPDLLEEGDLVQMADGTWKEISEIQKGDLVRGIKLPEKDDKNNPVHATTYITSQEEVRSESEYVENEVLYVGTNLGYIDKIKFILEDNTDWWDTAMSVYLVEDSENGLTGFKSLGKIKVGDSIYVLEDTEDSPKYLIKKVKSIETSRELVKSYSLTVSGTHNFLSKSSIDKAGYLTNVLLEHNYDIEKGAWYDCGDYCSDESDYPSWEEYTQFASQGITDFEASLAACESAQQSWAEGICVFIRGYYMNYIAMCGCYAPM